MPESLPSHIDIDYRALFEAMPQLVWSAQPDGRADYFNAAWYGFTTASEGSTNGDAWTRFLHPEDRQGTLSTWHTSLQTGEPYEMRHRIRGGAGQDYRWFLARANPLRGTRGEILRWIGTWTDIQQERTVAQELAQAKEDLEHFAYAASHDLVEPLRTILLYTQLVQQRCNEFLDERGRAALGTVAGAASRMMALLGNLRALLLSDGAEIQPREPLDANEVVNQVLEDLRAAREEAQAETIVEPLPALRVDRSHFAQIIQNLVGNALRYRAGRPARIRIGADTAATPPVFFVEDGGEGIAPKYQDQIFEAFQRLHGPRVPGSGLGLTICARLVEHYGGRIWVESTPGRGSRFLFTLPNASI